MKTTDLYERDFFQWTFRNAQLLREGRLRESDIEHIAEEIEDMGKRDQRAVWNNLRVLILHLIKWNLQPQKRSPSWKGSVIEHRSRLARLFYDSPSLKAYALCNLDDIYREAAENALTEMGMPKDTPEKCPWHFDQILDRAFFPD